MSIGAVDATIRASESFQQLRRAWPEIVFHDAISNANWGRLYSERPEFQFALVEEESAVVANAVRRRELARENRRVRRQGQRGGGDCLLEEDTLARQPIEVGRLDVVEAVGI